MARKRMISPTIWEDPSFNKLSVKARLGFIGMISHADDDGYVRADNGSLKRLIFGFDNDIDFLWIEELKTYKNLHFFENNDEIYAHLLNWDKHQTQRDDRKQASVYPECVICLTSDGHLPAEVKLSKVSKLSKEVKEASNLKTLNKLRQKLIREKVI